MSLISRITEIHNNKATATDMESEWFYEFEINLTDMSIKIKYNRHFNTRVVKYVIAIIATWKNIMIIGRSFKEKIDILKRFKQV